MRLTTPVIFNTDNPVNLVDYMVLRTHCRRHGILSRIMQALPPWTAIGPLSKFFEARISAYVTLYPTLRYRGPCISLIALAYRRFWI